MGGITNRAIHTDEVGKMGRYKPEEVRPIELKNSNLWIDENFTKKVQEETSLLISHLKQAGEKDHKLP